MNEWNILGIVQTSDKKAIRSAYIALLKKCHPEDDPEGFMKLRRAYEQALKSADQTKKWGMSEAHNFWPAQESMEEPDEEIEENQQAFFDRVKIVEEEITGSENKGSGSGYEYIQINEEIEESQQAFFDRVTIEEEETAGSENKGSGSGYEYIQINDVWIQPKTSGQSLYEQMNVLYGDVFKRREVNEWRKLFLQISLVENVSISDEVVRFLTVHAHLPHEVWSYLNDEFALCEQPDFPWKELIRYDFGLSLTYLNPGVQCDFEQYAHLRFQSFQLLQNMKYGESIETGRQAALLYADDPVLYRLLGIACYKQANYKQAIISLSKSLDYIPGDLDSRVFRGYAYYQSGLFEEATADFAVIVASDPKHAEARKGYVLSVQAMKALKRKAVSTIGLHEITKMDLEMDSLYKCTKQKMLVGPTSTKDKFMGFLKLNKKLIFPILSFGVILLGSLYEMIKLCLEIEDLSLTWLLALAPIACLIKLFLLINKLER